MFSHVFVAESVPAASLRAHLACLLTVFLACAHDPQPSPPATSLLTPSEEAALRFAAQHPSSTEIPTPKSWGEPSGRLSRDVIQDTMNTTPSAIAACYEERIRLAPNLAGKIVLKFQVLADGTVGQVVKRSDLDDQQLEDCIIRVVRSLRFPTFDGTWIEVQYPYIFRR